LGERGGGREGAGRRETDDFAGIEGGAPPTWGLSGTTVEALSTEILSFFRGSIVGMHDGDGAHSRIEEAWRGRNTRDRGRGGGRPIEGMWVLVVGCLRDLGGDYHGGRMIQVDGIVVLVPFLVT